MKTLVLAFATLFIQLITTCCWAQNNNQSVSQSGSQSVLARAVNPNSALANLQTENAQLKTQLEKLQQDHQQLLVDTEDMRQSATNAYDTEEQKKYLEEQQQQIVQQNQLLQTEADVLRNENEKLRKTDHYNQLLYGGALILIGVLLSFILQAIGGRRKRYSEWG